jgi:hypothetical protein
MGRTMNNVKVAFDLPDILGVKLDFLCENPTPSDVEVADALLKFLDEHKVVSYDEPIDADLSVIEALARYGVANVMYSLDGGPQVPLRRSRK